MPSRNYAAACYLRGRARRPGRALNSYHWVFYGALSNVEDTITVTDMETGRTKTYFNPQGQLASVADTAAF